MCNISQTLALAVLLGVGLSAAAAAPPADDSLSQTILALEKKGWEAFKKQDWGALKATVADDFLAITTDGKRLSRDELAKELAQVKLTSYTITDPKAVRLTPDAAVLTYRLKANYVAEGMKLTEDVWVSSSWAKRAGKWVNVTYHESPAKK